MSLTRSLYRSLIRAADRYATRAQQQKLLATPEIDRFFLATNREGGYEYHSILHRHGVHDPIMTPSIARAFIRQAFRSSETYLIYHISKQLGMAVTPSIEPQPITSIDATDSHPYLSSSIHGTTSQLQSHPSYQHTYDTIRAQLIDDGFTLLRTLRTRTHVLTLFPTSRMSSRTTTHYYNMSIPPRPINMPHDMPTEMQRHSSPSPLLSDTIPSPSPPPSSSPSPPPMRVRIDIRSQLTRKHKYDMENETYRFSYQVRIIHIDDSIPSISFFQKKPKKAFTEPPFLQLLSRQWQYIDENLEEVTISGPGVVGAFPRLHPGEMYVYESSVEIPTSMGMMCGIFTFVDDRGQTFDAAIDPILLDGRTYGPAHLSDADREAQELAKAPPFAPPPPPPPPHPHENTTSSQIP